MQITLYNDSLKKWTKVYILFIFLILQSAVILYYSSQTATQSSGISRAVMSKLDWVPETVPREKSDGSYGGVTLHFIIRKMAHTYNYFIVGCCICAIRFYFDKGVFMDFVWPCYGIFLGTIDEIYQHFVPGRCGRVTDACVDISGTFLGYISIYLLFSLIFSKRCILWKKAKRK